MTGTTKAVWGAAAVVSVITVVTAVVVCDHIEKDIERKYLELRDIVS